MGENGKGSKRRPKSIDQETWNKNWENIFGKSKKKSRQAVDRSITDGTMKKSMRGTQSRD